MKYLFPVFALIFLIFPLVVGAQYDFDNCDDLRSSVGENTAKFCEIIKKIETILFILGGALAVVIVIISGIQYLTSAGDQAKADKAKKTLTYGLIGAAIIFASAFIIDLLAELLGDIIY